MGCQRMPQGARGCQRIPQGARGCHRVPGDATGCQRMPGAAIRCHGVPEDATGCQGLPEGARGYHRVPEEATGCQEQPEGARGCHEGGNHDQNQFPSGPHSLRTSCYSQLLRWRRIFNFVISFSYRARHLEVAPVPCYSRIKTFFLMFQVFLFLDLCLYLLLILDGFALSPSLFFL
ncbi:hypothetical protein ATANTOWER_032293 [Ataeniobius toweri]|uniref:Uncharacterized protein n=1 Tax=Ataeniobius toweri TaxID=208326 RepID=A0ABU7CEH6_9TELE|nr:hypothetical protein [Ataeniobius toweri]